ncbi:hypothetical protein ACFQ1S_09900 [Kibdelosporangium lantanae]|uniref:DUF4034 domain-containing protein n=1 Tax=Kibdelosporangium lantanae TaxID=1497396 RepID=A0ABW3M6C4_9PSEU
MSELGGQTLGVSPPRPSSAGEDGERYADQVEAFRADLVAIWNRNGSPELWEMARKSGQPAGRFRFLGDPPGSGLPEWRDVETFLAATGQSKTRVDQLERRWKELDRHRQLDRRVGFWRERTAAALYDVGDGHDRHEPWLYLPDKGMGTGGVLARAMAAESRADFVACLAEYRASIGVSFTDIAKEPCWLWSRSTANRIVQPGQFPGSAKQVAAFVMACGANESEAGLWTRAWSRAERMYPHDDNPVDGLSLIRMHQKAAAVFASRGEWEIAYRHMRSAFDFLYQDKVWVVKEEDWAVAG